MRRPGTLNAQDSGVGDSPVFRSSEEPATEADPRIVRKFDKSIFAPNAMTATLRALVNMKAGTTAAATINW